MKILIGYGLLLLLLIAVLVGSALVAKRGTLTPVEATEFFYNGWIVEREKTGKSPLLSDLHHRSTYANESLQRTLQRELERVRAGSPDPVLCSTRVPESVLVDVVNLEDAQASLVVVLQYEGKPVRIRVLARKTNDWWHLDEIDCLEIDSGGATTEQQSDGGEASTTIDAAADEAA